MCRTSIRYQVQDSQRVQERRGDDEWAGTDAVAWSGTDELDLGDLIGCIDRSV